MIPRLTIARWSGQDDALHYYTGSSIAIEWLGLIIELNIGKARP